jgi:hypothetical protein
MTTPTSAGKSPNNVAKSQDDGKCSLGGCPLMKAKIQLIPLRYGLVERLDPSSALAMPYKTTSRPLGIRLIRDGWLYVIVDKKPQAVMHEYRIQNGIVTQLLWEKGEITANKRESNVGEAVLVFPRSSKLYVNYSEVQWTAAKCAQVIKHKSEREYFMQAVDLTKADPEKGAANLLTPSQAEKWIAEVAEQPSKSPAATGAKPEESKDYLWEQIKLFKKTQMGTLKKQVKAENEHDHLYLVVQDDLGVLRDLAEHQDLVSSWIIDWSEAEANQKKYVFGSYIESLYTIDGNSVAESAKQDPRFENIRKDTDETQRKSISEYINAKYQTSWSGPGNLKSATAAAKMRMRQNLGEPLYARYKDFIESLDDNTHDALYGAKMGQDGIDDLIDRPAMEAFLKQQRTQLQRWNRRLDAITEDRSSLLKDQRFHKSAWYFDTNYSNQMDEALSTEYACLKDVCRTDNSTETIAKLREENPGFGVNAFYTLSRTDQKDMQAKMLSAAKSIRDLFLSKKDYEDMKALSGKFDNLVRVALPATFQLSESGITFSQAVSNAYDPAKQLGLANALDEAMAAMRNGAPLDPAKVLRHIPGATWLDVLKAFGKSGITLEFSSANQIRAFQQDVDKLVSIRKEMKSLKHKIKQTLAKERKGLVPAGSHKPYSTQRKSLQKSLPALENRVSSAISPIGDGPCKAGYKIKNLTAAQETEFNRMVDDFRNKRKFENLGKNVFLSAGGDLFATTAAVVQIISFITVYEEFRRKPDLDANDIQAFINSLTSTTGGIFAAAQGISITVISTVMDNYASAAGKTKNAARLGKLVGGLGIFAYTLGFAAAATSMFGEKGSVARWSEALRTGDKATLIGASMTLVGDTGQFALNGWSAVATGNQLIRTATGAVAWTTSGVRLITIAMRVNLIGFVLTALQLAGEAIYNYNNKSKLDKWLSESAWGHKNANHSLRDERVRVADLASPRAELKTIKNKPMVVLQFPGIAVRDLDETGIGVSAYWLTNMQRNDWEPWSEQLSYQFELLSAPHEPLTIGLEIFQHESNAQHGLAMELRYHPVPGENEVVREKRFQIETLFVEQGKSKSMSEVIAFRARKADAPWVIVSSDVLSLSETSATTGKI